HPVRAWQSGRHSAGAASPHVVSGWPNFVVSLQTIEQPFVTLQPELHAGIVLIASSVSASVCSSCDPHAAAASMVSVTVRNVRVFIAATQEQPTFPLMDRDEKRFLE